MSFVDFVCSGVGLVVTLWGVGFTAGLWLVGMAFAANLNDKEEI